MNLEPRGVWISTNQLNPTSWFYSLQIMTMRRVLTALINIDPTGKTTILIVIIFFFYHLKHYIICYSNY